MSSLSKKGELIQTVNYFDKYVIQVFEASDRSDGPLWIAEKFTASLYEQNGVERKAPRHESVVV